MQTSKERLGQAAIGGHAFTEALLAVVGKELNKTFNTVFHMSLAAPVALFAVGAMVMWSDGRKKLRGKLSNKSVWKPLVLSTIMFGFVLPFATVYATNYTSAGNVSLILTLEIVLSYLYFQKREGQELNKVQTIGAALMFTSTLIVLLANFVQFQIGDFIVLLPVFLIPKANDYTKEAKKVLTGQEIIFRRSLLVVPLFLVWSMFWPSQYHLLDARSLLLIGVMGMLALGIGKILWVEGISRIPVTMAASIASVKVILTHVLGALILHTAPTTAQWLAVPTAVAGIILLQREKKPVPAKV